MRNYFDRVCRAVIDNRDNIVIENLRIKFEIVKSADPQENTGRIEIFNLSGGTRRKIENSDGRVKLFAGYANNKGLVRVGEGDISSVNTSRDKVERVTQIYIAEGRETIKVNSVSLSIKDKASLDNILREFTEKSSLTFKTIGIDKSITLDDGYSAIGGPDVVLNELGEIFNFTWSVQNGIVIIRGEGRIESGEVPLLGPSTGLILNPETVKKVSRKLAKSPAPLPRNAYSVQALLQPHLNIHDFIKVESEDLSGTYRIIKISHTGDTRGNDWYSNMEVVRI